MRLYRYRSPHALHSEGLPSAPHRHWTVLEVPQLAHARGPAPISGERHDEPLVAAVVAVAAVGSGWPRGRMGVWQARAAAVAAAADVVVVEEPVGTGGNDVAHQADDDAGDGDDDERAASGRDRTEA